MASECGCHGGVIDNGFVATGNCKVYSYACDIYCSYYCDDGYMKTASSVYCAGNEQWVPTGTHPSSKERACTVRTAYAALEVKDNAGFGFFTGQPVEFHFIIEEEWGIRNLCHSDDFKDAIWHTENGYDECKNIFFDHGYIVSCPTPETTSRRECFYRCFHGYKQTSNKVYCTRDGWVDTLNNSAPCIRDGNPTTVRTDRPTTTISMPTPPPTPYRGYYDDPNLKMDVSPVIFVAAVIGGIIVLALLVFAIFFRAHRKTTREVRRRAVFVDSCDPFSSQNDYTNFQDNSAADDSGFRDIARRIIDQSAIEQQRHNVTIPPPYDGNSTANINRSDNETYDGLTAPPYSEVYSTGTPNPDLVPYHSFTHQQISQTDRNTNAVNPDKIDGTNENTDKPPPYEAIDNETNNDMSTGFNPTNAPNEQIDPPPPYSVYGGTG